MRLGAAMYDITGPAAEAGMFGYAQIHQATTGIHMRLRSRAFVFHDDSTSVADDETKHFAFVSVDTGCISELITQSVIARLQAHDDVFPSSTFQTHNVMLSATHTHCAPGGLSEYPLYSMHPPLKGFDKQNFECVVAGIVKSIVRAYRNLQPGVIRVARGDCLAAFAQSNEGDVSPNIFGPRTSANEHHDLERMEIVAEAQLETARHLYMSAATAAPEATSAIRCVHQYVDYNSIALGTKWHVHKECSPSTSSGCIGVSMLSGTHFDGRGVRLIPEGLQWGAKCWFTLMPQTQSMQKEKPIIFPTASTGMSPSILPLQLVVLGPSLVLAAMPFETTTMAGRRLRRSIAAALELPTANTVVLAGLANAYCGYMTTREEYAIQRYEGASTHFGPNQLVATQQQFDELATALRLRTLPPSAPQPHKVSTSNWHTPVLHDSAGGPNWRFGQVVVDEERQSLGPGDIAQAVFCAGHPKNDLRIQSTFLEIQRWRSFAGCGCGSGGVWVLHADDSDPQTFFHWKRSGLSASLVTIVWHIPPSTPPGRYRIKHNGHYKQHWNNDVVVAYCGVSRAFDVDEVAKGSTKPVGDTLAETLQETNVLYRVPEPTTARMGHADEKEEAEMDWTSPSLKRRMTGGRWPSGKWKQNG
ncbi:hypothetical protein DYB30_011528 [Aphanomyces astaci]|uniref:Neutral ceramidase n=1 Tax=Aphanomyces astaci TaxID=112090 RepID=A0A397FJP5_APHAT|nr:hypothetical protein DYB30_011528 [Aphanomyces astaci]RHY91988.1 hypothetical protein DYB26_007157 [Aphanomyces astaci]RHZ27654.1 hypothetical protein DYB31_006339 [Aphanomyces astaci]